VVVGAQWGDEGKGKIVDALSAEADVIARYQGGPNAGHSVIRQGQTVVLQLLPSGILTTGKRCLIGNGVVVDLTRLREEASRIEALGVDVGARLGVSAAAHVILPYHLAAERVAEQGQGAIGTTGRGIGFAYRDKAARTGLRVGDLFDAPWFLERAGRNLNRLQREFPESDELKAMTAQQVLDGLADLARWVEPMVTDVSFELHEALGHGRSVLLEGAQGTLLDIDHGTYPFVTSSSTTSGGAATGVGIAPKELDSVIGVVKAYTTRVGNGPLPTEFDEPLGSRVRQLGNEFGATTGRPRRCGWFDGVVVRYAARVNGLTDLAVTKLDVLDTLERIGLCTGYEVGGDFYDEFPGDLDLLERAVPRYEWFEGWNTSTVAIRSSGWKARFRWVSPSSRRYRSCRWITTRTSSSSAEAPVVWPRPCRRNAPD
jgi:adenylosuccinate synthase